MRREARREAEVAEDDVLDPVAHVALADGTGLDGLLVRQSQHDRYVVCAERPQRVLVRPQLAEVEAVGVDVVDLAELTRVGDLLQLLNAGVVFEQVPHHQDPPRRPRRLRHLLGLCRRLGQRLFDEAVLPGLQDTRRELRMGRDVRRDHDSVELGILEQLVELAALARPG